MLRNVVVVEVVVGVLVVLEPGTMLFCTILGEKRLQTNHRFSPLRTAFQSSGVCPNREASVVKRLGGKYSPPCREYGLGLSP